MSKDFLKVVRQYIRADSDGRIVVFDCNENNMTLKQYDLPKSHYGKYKDQIEEARNRRGTWPNQVQISGDDFKIKFKK